MNEVKLIYQLIGCKNKEYILGLDRVERSEYKSSHIYKGNFSEIEKAMCSRASNSIWRNNLGNGICKICLKNTLKEYNGRKKTT